MLIHFICVNSVEISKSRKKFSIITRNTVSRGASRWLEGTGSKKSLKNHVLVLSLLYMDRHNTLRERKAS